MLLQFIAQVFKESTSLMQKDKIITALELIGAILMNFKLLSVSPMLFGLECMFHLLQFLFYLLLFMDEQYFLVVHLFYDAFPVFNSRSVS